MNASPNAALGSSVRLPRVSFSIPVCSPCCTFLTNTNTPCTLRFLSEHGLERPQEGLAGVFQIVAAQEQLGKYNSRTIAPTLWLQRHVNGISYFQLAVSLLAESNMEKGLSSGTLPFFIFNNLPNTRMIEYHPLNLVRQLLAPAGSINSNIQLESSPHLAVKLIIIHHTLLAI